MKNIFFIILLNIFLIYSHLSYCQEVKDSGNTSLSSVKRKDKEHKKKRLIQLIKKDTKGLLLGNSCMDKVLYDMGFEYVVQIKGRAGNRSEFGRLVHNLGAKMAILFRNGPFWKIKLKKKRKECRNLTGDFIG